MRNYYDREKLISQNEKAMRNFPSRSHKRKIRYQRPYESSGNEETDNIGFIRKRKKQEKNMKTLMKIMMTLMTILIIMQMTKNFQKMIMIIMIMMKNTIKIKIKKK